VKFKMNSRLNSLFLATVFVTFFSPDISARTCRQSLQTAAERIHQIFCSKTPSLSLGGAQKNLTIEPGKTYTLPEWHAYFADVLKELSTGKPMRNDLLNELSDLFSGGDFLKLFKPIDLELNHQSHFQRDHLRGLIQALEAFDRLPSRAELFEPVDDIRLHESEGKLWPGHSLRFKSESKNHLVRLVFRNSVWELTVLGDRSDASTGLVLAFDIDKRHYRKVSDWNEYEKTLLESEFALRHQLSRLNRRLRATPKISSQQLETQRDEVSQALIGVEQQIKQVRQDALGDRTLLTNTLVYFVHSFLTQKVDNQARYFPNGYIDDFDLSIFKDLGSLFKEGEKIPTRVQILTVVQNIERILREQIQNTYTYLPGGITLLSVKPTAR
jgi:hypothetical protein